MKFEFEATARPPRKRKVGHPHIVFEAHPAHMEYFHLVTVPMKKAERKKWWGKRVRVTVEILE